MSSTYIAVMQVPAIGSPNGWIRTAKTVYISKHASPHLVGAITEAMKQR
jgi:hypothetical protein